MSRLRRTRMVTGRTQPIMMSNRPRLLRRARGGVHGDQAQRPASLAHRRELGVGLLAEQFGELGGVGLPHRPAPTCAAGSPVQYQCRSAPPSPQPRRSYSVMVVLRISVPSGRVTHSWVRRIGSCQHTSGFIVSGSTPRLSALVCSAQPMPPAKPGPVQEDAGALVLSGPQVGFAVVLVHLEVALAAQTLRPELPVLVGQRLDRVVEAGAVVVVGQERAVRAAPVVGSALDRALAGRACRTRRSSATAARSYRRRSGALGCRGRRTPPIRGRSRVPPRRARCGSAHGIQR